MTQACRALAAILGLVCVASPPGRAASPFPAITDGKIATPVVNIGKAPALPRVEIGYTAPAGLAMVSFAFFSPSRRQTLEVTYLPSAPNGRAGRISLQNAGGGSLGMYAEAGLWTMQIGAISDFSGQVMYYTPAQLAAIFPAISFKLVNLNPADVTPPSVTSGVLLTPRISLAAADHYAAIELGVADDVSGAATAEFDVISPDQNYYQLTGLAPGPMRSGKILTGLDVSSVAHARGTWTIVGYTVTDVQGNRLADYNAGDIQALLGTTTFKVTN